MVEIFRFEKRLEKLLARWEDIEHSIKRAELLQGQITLPAINELRYAGRHIIRAISQHRKTDNTNTYEDALVCAEQYLNNADNDIIDSVVMYIGSRVNELNLRFGRQTIISLYSPYADLLQTLKRCEENILMSRRDATNREFLYNEMKNHDMPRLLKGFDDLFDADFMMTIQIQEEKNKTLRFKYYFFLTTIISTVSTAIVIVLVAHIFI